MHNAVFPKAVSEVVATLADIFRHQGRGEILELLENAHARFDETNYNNWNGGTSNWALRLEVPVPLYATLEPRLAAIEKQIVAKLSYLGRLHPNDPVGEVTITPIAPGAAVFGQRMAPSEIEVREMWPERRLRLFLSHTSKHKVSVGKLKNELGRWGVAAFVAHEDIEPSLEWRKEIELALRSMHAVAAIFTSDFHASPWTDQEVGWALGRGLLVVPVRVGADPNGFATKYQWVNGSLEFPESLASSLVDALLVNPQTHGEMRRALVTAFVHADSFMATLALRDTVLAVVDFTEDEKLALIEACSENSQVVGAFGVPAAIKRAFGKTTPTETAPPLDTAF